MKKYRILIILILLVIAAVSVWAGRLIYRAVYPAIGPSDIQINQAAEVINQKEDQNEEEKPEPENEENFDLPLSYPEDFQAFIYAGGLGKARDIMAAPQGILVTSMSAGKVIYLPDADGDNKADEKIEILTGRYNPHGMEEYCAGEECWFYLAETDAVYRFAYDKDNIELSGEERIIELPDDGGHYTRHVLLIEQDGEPRLLTTVGSKCNVCVEDDWRRAKILISDPDGANLEEYASGLRNSVFMEQNPFTGEVYAADMGRDWLGDELPPEEINVIKKGSNYGWPYCYGDKIHDSEFDKNTYIQDPCQDTSPPKITMPAHTAPLGLSFVPEQGFGEKYWHDLLVAQHGSWNRSTLVGYQIIIMELDENGNYSGATEFITGFLQDGEAWGRPADVLALPGGKIFVSDDKAGAIYLFEYKQQ